MPIEETLLKLYVNECRLDLLCRLRSASFITFLDTVENCADPLLTIHIECVNKNNNIDNIATIWPYFCLLNLDVFCFGHLILIATFWSEAFENVFPYFCGISLVTSFRDVAPVSGGVMNYVSWHLRFTNLSAQLRDSKGRFDARRTKTNQQFHNN